MSAFEAANYRRALDYFERVYQRRPVHSRTAAAVVMAGKALYRTGAYQRCLNLLRDFGRDFPASKYRAEAGRVYAYAELQLQHASSRRDAVRLGVALPMNVDDRTLTQALFNGIHVAVRERNGAGERQVRIVFRDTENSEIGARRAVASLVDENVDVIIGPLYSEEARGAAAEAERAGVVLVAPLATGEEITEGRRYVFQANPTIVRRGAYLARWAIEYRGFTRLGIVVDRSDELSRQMAEGFYREVTRLGAGVAFYTRLYSPMDWPRLTELVAPDMLESADAVYLPVHADLERDALRFATEALAELKSLPRSPYVLGSEAFGHVAWGPQTGSVQATFVDTYRETVNSPEGQRFSRRFRDLSQGMQPGRLAVAGYDVTRLLLDLLLKETRYPLITRLERAAPYDGLGTRIHFARGQRNEAMFLYHANAEGIRLAR